MCLCVAVWGEAMGSASAMEEPWDHRVAWANHLLWDETCDAVASLSCLLQRTAYRAF